MKSLISSFRANCAFFSAIFLICLYSLLEENISYAEQKALKSCESFLKESTLDKFISLKSRIRTAHPTKNSENQNLPDIFTDIAGDPLFRESPIAHILFGYRAYEHEMYFIALAHVEYARSLMQKTNFCNHELIQDLIDVGMYNSIIRIGEGKEWIGYYQSFLETGKNYKIYRFEISKVICIVDNLDLHALTKANTYSLHQQACGL